MKKMVTSDELGAIRRRHEKIVMCSGCFDILQSGHGVFFNQCREFGDTLVVAIGRDSVIRALKGPSRPVNPQNNRMYLLASMQPIDYVCLGGDEILPGKIDFAEQMEKLRPDVFVLNDDDIAIVEKRALCEKFGVELVLVGRVVPDILKPTSTTEIIEQVQTGSGSSVTQTPVVSPVESLFKMTGQLSASRLTECLAGDDDRLHTIRDILDRLSQTSFVEQPDLPNFIPSRVTHSLATAMENEKLAGSIDPGQLRDIIPPKLHAWLGEKNIDVGPNDFVSWSERLKSCAFRVIENQIVTGRKIWPVLPSNVLREDEIVWGRSPARIDLAGGWSDTPPHALIDGGRVTNFAIDLKGQSPIHCYARVIDRPVIKINSIDLGKNVEVCCLDDLLDYGGASSEFGLVKAALALSGLSPQSADWGDGVTLEEILKSFGGGIELTTLSAIPKGSGLGTSSVIGATILGVINRVFGRALTTNELFYEVLRLEQALTTGGGWQDQLGGGVGGAKLLSTKPGLIPDISIQYLPEKILDSEMCLLYYTGITRLAKNVLQQVVSSILDGDELTLKTLSEISSLADTVASSLMEMDYDALGHCLSESWRLNKQIASSTTNSDVEELLEIIAPHISGAKLAGAGGGGFMFMLCKSPADAKAVVEKLTKNPINPKARFFDYRVNTTGLRVTVC